MSLSAGNKLGPYEILAPLGAGGMGEVYRARDTRLQRDVALKILTEATSGNAERRARFEREARAVAALNHPNIVSIYDVGTESGVFYIVSELVDGESLRDRMQRGHISVRELLQIAVQIADGIAAAHSAGFVHRDLKPENIMLTTAARVKILDFGLARQVLAPSTPEHTLTIQNTLPGTILGTVNYMSPEQARGLEAGPQSDQFSLGAVLYELATGRRAFERDTTPQTLTAILVEEPKPLDPKLPAPLRWTIDRCLAKDPKARYASTHDPQSTRPFLRSLPHQFGGRGGRAEGQAQLAPHRHTDRLSCRRDRGRVTARPQAARHRKLQIHSHRDYARKPRRRLLVA
jgi:serine/threonine protein kinase